MAKYESLPLEQREITDIAFEINDSEMNELVDEVYRIKEDVEEKVKDSHKDSYLQAFGLLLSMFLVAIGIIIVLLVIVSSMNDKQVPNGFIYQMGKLVFEYFLGDYIYNPEQ